LTELTVTTTKEKDMNATVYATLYYSVMQAFSSMGTPSGTPSDMSWRSTVSKVWTQKKLWLRINRALAWGLIVSPALQIMLGSALVPGLILDLVILLLHGGLSVWLFGLPKSPKGDDGTMHWIGTSEARMSPRNRFLLSGWRLMISSLYLLSIPLLVTLGSALPDGWGLGVVLIPAGLGMLLVFNFFSVMWPYAAVTHVFGASGYAMRRWGALDSLGSYTAAAPWVSGLIVLLFMATSIANVFKSLWS
jgi:hypothetical protein